MRLTVDQLVMLALESGADEVIFSRAVGAGVVARVTPDYRSAAQGANTAACEDRTPAKALAGAIEDSGLKLRANRFLAGMRSE